MTFDSNLQTFLKEAKIEEKEILAFGLNHANFDRVNSNEGEILEKCSNLCKTLERPLLLIPHSNALNNLR
jgi:hypothetical protein